MERICITVLQLANPSFKNCGDDADDESAPPFETLPFEFEFEFCFVDNGDDDDDDEDVGILVLVLLVFSSTEYFPNIFMFVLLSSSDLL